MCGIFGGIKNMNKDKIRLLGILNQSRGSDGSGLYDGDSIIKANYTFQMLCNSGGYEFIESAKNFIIGHTRYATCGEKSKENAHPFRSGKIVGVHNGQIRNFFELKRKYDIWSLQVDSEIIFYLLDKKGIEGLKELVGYYTVVWYNLENPDKIYFIQHECDLAYARDKDSFYFCSDIDDLYSAVGYDIKSIETIEDTLYTVDINTLKIKQKKIKGLQADSGYNYSKHGYTGNTYSSTKGNMGIGCDVEDDEHYKIEYDEEDWKKDWFYPTSSEQSHKHTHSTMDKRDMPYYYRCPTCTEYLTEREVLKGVCSFCHTELSAVIYKCLDCQGKMLLEDLLIQEDDKCVNCGGMTQEISEETLA